AALGGNRPELAVFVLVPTRERDPFAVRGPCRRKLSRRERIRREPPWFAIGQIHQPKFSDRLKDDSLSIGRSTLPANEFCFKRLVVQRQRRIRHLRNRAMHVSAEGHRSHFAAVHPEPANLSA